jgi:hypothetical protein
VLAGGHIGVAHTGDGVAQIGDGIVDIGDGDIGDFVDKLKNL